MQSRQKHSPEISLPGFKTRHQLDFLAANWGGLMALLQRVTDENGDVAFFRSRQTKCGSFEVSLGIEGIAAETLAAVITSNVSLKSVRLEHLLIRAHNK